MQSSTIGNSLIKASVLGFGCMSLPEDYKEAERILHAAVDGGITYFDTADLYQFGRNEENVGRGLTPYRNSVTIATKGGNDWSSDQTTWSWNPSKSYLIEACKQSLKRLNTDSIDVYQLHGGTIDDPFDETREALELLKRDGLIQAYGTSSIRPNVINKWAPVTGVVSNMMQYSILDRRPEELSAFLQEHSVSIIARGPLAKGLLTERFTRKLTDEGYLSYSGSELRDTLHDLQAYASDWGMTLNSLALRYVLADPACDVVIPGASSVEQVQETILAAEAGPLSDQQLKDIRSLTKAEHYENHRV
ncbi:aldo/keto reductase [Alkalicoccus luteus]|uniref:aldo/keto reductase n=1 Tax=Alkalicoccus luteus TaxID=1237094 RepID=UPI0040344355